MDIDIVKDIFIFDSEEVSINEKYKSYDIDIESLANDLPSDEVCESIDEAIYIIIVRVIRLKELLKTPQKVNEYIRAVLLDIEQVKKREEIKK
jgi:hypothetical protein